MIKEDSGQLASFLNSEELNRISSKDVKTSNNIPPFDFSKVFISMPNVEHMSNRNSMAIWGDNINILKNMRDRSVNLIFADAPYNIGKDFGNGSDKWGSVEEYNQ